MATARILHVSAHREAMLERLAIHALGRSAATGCAGSPATVAPALTAAGLPTLLVAGSREHQLGLGRQPPRRPWLAVARRRGGANLTVTPSGAHTERAQTGASFPSAVVTSLLGLLLAIAMVVVPKLRHRVVAGAGASAPTPSVPPQNEMGDRAFRARVIPMDSAIAPMAADAFSRMANDADPATDSRERTSGRE